MSKAYLEAQQISVRFGGLTAVDNVSFSIGPAEVLGVIGPNGAGKTTLLRVIGGSLRPSSGTLLLDGQPLRAGAPHQACARGIARTFQVPRPFVSLSTLDNVAVAALVQKGGRRQARDQALQTLQLVGLTARQDQLAGSLNLVERKKLELAKALATGPRILLLDEIFEGLNDAEVDELMALVGGLKAAGLAVLMVEHVIKAVRTVADRLMALDYGRLIALGAVDAVLRNQRVQEAYLGAAAADL